VTTNHESLQFDVLIVGSGIAGALAADLLQKEGKRVLMIEAGGRPPYEGKKRIEMVENYFTSPAKSPDAPFCGDNILAAQPNPVDTGRNYYVYDYAGPVRNTKQFLSYYERLVGGTTWHWQGIYLRMLPNDFKMSKYGQSGSNWPFRDWPFQYDEIVPYYQKAEQEMGVAGNIEDDTYSPKDAKLGPKYPMEALVPSYLDQQIGSALKDYESKGHAFNGMALKVGTVPHAINSKPFQGRPPCDGRTSCVPLCPNQARYEAIIHVDRAIKRGAQLWERCVVTRLDPAIDGSRIKGLWYKRWKWDGARTVVSAEQYVSAKIVVLAANGIENPMIMLRSGVKNDAIGRYLMDHPIKQSFALARDPVYPFRGPQTTSHIDAFRDGAFRSTLAAFKTSLKNDGWSTTATGAPRGNLIPTASPQGSPDWNPGTILDLVHNRGVFGKSLRSKLHDHAVRQVTLNSACEQPPIAGNRVLLSGKADDLGIERPLIQYNVDDPQGFVRNSFKKIVDLHAFVFDALGADNRVMQRDADDQELVYGGSGHIMGTTIMGDKGSSVVNGDGRSHDFSNLYVIGSSVFPTSSTANPTSTVAALAIRTAETILGKRTSKTA
jgi:choline dehydrogenase-like flavoprotein